MGSSQHSRSSIIVVEFNSLSNWNAREIGEFDSVTGLSGTMLLVVISQDVGRGALGMRRCLSSHEVRE